MCQFTPTNTNDIDREEYERNLVERQRKHLEEINSEPKPNWRPCLHDSCDQCCGTGIKKDKSRCIHMISCPCPKCTPSYMNEKPKSWTAYSL